MTGAGLCCEQATWLAGAAPTPAALLNPPGTPANPSAHSPNYTAQIANTSRQSATRLQPAIYCPRRPPACCACWRACCATACCGRRKSCGAPPPQRSTALPTRWAGVVLGES